MTAAVTMRLDHLLVERGLAPSGARARALVMSGRVRVAGKTVDKAGTRVDRDAHVEVASPPHPYVSRGGAKLAGALRELGVNPAGRMALDIGASTGGFTDCLLQHGATRVVAVDVGHGQFDWTLRNDSRVTVIERYNARHLEADSLQQVAGASIDVRRLDLGVVDVSFISLALILPPLRRLDGLEQVICLVKPQFEVGRRQVGKGGIVRDPALRADALQRVAAAAEAAAWTVTALCPSPLPGADGNREYFLALHRQGAGGLPADELRHRIITLTGACA